MNPSPAPIEAAFWQAAQVAVAFLGGWLFSLAGAPAAWISGSMVAVALLCATGRGVPVVPGLSDAALLFAGITMGAAATPETFAAFARYPLSLVLLALCIVVVVLVSGQWLVRVSGWSKVDAVLGSAPGAMSTVLAVAAERGTSVGAIAVVQSLRLAALVVILPSVVFSLRDKELPLTDAGPAMGAATLAMIAFPGLAAALVFERLGVAAPMLFGAAAVSAVLHGTGSVVGGFPTPLAVLSFVLLGTYTGSRFRNLTRAALIASLPAALGSFLVSMAVALAFAWLASTAVDVPLGTALVAFAPGGLEAMTVLALGLDPLYVGAHHLARFLAIGFALPLAIGWMSGPRKP